MLYVFQVDTGMMLTFEMQIAMETVASLKRRIASKTGISEDKQVLLISGGESLDSKQRVCTYSAGTDTSPIFLFAKINIESPQPPQLARIDCGLEPGGAGGMSANLASDMSEMIESCKSMQPSYNTLIARAELATELYEFSARQKEICERLVLDQHMQQQGWAAVTANLEDLTRAFRQKSEMMLHAFMEFLKTKPSHKEMIDKFSGDIQLLNKIPILPSLIEHNKLDQLQLASSSPHYSNTHHHPHPHRSSLSDARRKTGENKSGEVNAKPEKDKNKSRKNKSQDSSSDKSSEIKFGEDQDESDNYVQDSTATKHGDFSSSKFKSALSSDLPELSNFSDDAKNPSVKSTMKDKSKSSQDLEPESTQEAKTKELRINETNEGKKLPSLEEQEQMITLHQWIDSHDNQNCLTSLAEYCLRGLERFNDGIAEQIRLEVQEVLKSANNQSMKEVKGLEERLFGLEKLMSEAKKCVYEQDQLASSFRNHKERMTKHRDISILPDLCASHGHQLDMMLANHQKMNDFRRRCLRAKEELSANLHARLRWIMYVEQQLSDLDAKLMIYRENLLRLNKQLEIVTQIHRAPTLYSEAVVEVLRRRKFAKKFMLWSTSLARKSMELYRHEMERRKEFDHKIGAHFLCNLFPGLSNSYPPAFATVKPQPFDTDLPRITAADIRYLRSSLGCTSPTDSTASPASNSILLLDLLEIPDDVAMPHIVIKPNKKRTLNKSHTCSARAPVSNSPLVHTCKAQDRSPTDLAADSKVTTETEDDNPGVNMSEDTSKKDGHCLACAVPICQACTNDDQSDLDLKLDQEGVYYSDDSDDGHQSSNPTPPSSPTG